MIFVKVLILRTPYVHTNLIAPAAPVCYKKLI